MSLVINPFVAFSDVPDLRPSAQWNGTAGSGFGTANPAAPTDPTRTTAKPACQLLVPPDQPFTDRLLVGVIAGANYNGSLIDNLGLQKVVVHYEGATTDILAPSFQTFDDANGNPVTYLGWWVWLKHNGTHGTANIYIEAVAKDATMQRRVIGPYKFYPVATQHDLELEVAPTPAEVTGVRYKTILAALNYIKNLPALRPRITITEAGSYLVEAGTTTYDCPGRITIEATIPVTIGYTSNPAFDVGLRIQPRMPLHWRGDNITFDFAYTSEHYTQLSGQLVEHWFDGVTFTDSIGRYNLWGGGPRVVNPFRGSPYFTECTFSKLRDAGKGNTLIRGCTFTETYNDLFNGVPALIDNTVYDHDSSDYKNDLLAMTVTYAGVEATATLACPGSSNSTRTWTATWGANSATFQTLATIGAWNTGTNATFQNVADWLNGLGVGFTATVVDNTRRASAATLTGISNAGGFAAQNVKGATVSVLAKFDLHGDWYQTSTGGDVENRIIMGNVARLSRAQQLHISQASHLRDVLIVNNVWENEQEGQYNSNLGGPNSHVVIAHNSLLGQDFRFVTTGTYTYSSDGYTLLANNVSAGFNSSGTATPVITNNHVYASGNLPMIGTGNTQGGTKASLFVDAAGGDFSPAGELLANPAGPVVKYDPERVLRGATAAKGALA